MTTGKEHIQKWWEARLATMTEEELAEERARAEELGRRVVMAKQEAELKVRNLKLTPPRGIEELLGMAKEAGIPREEALEMKYWEIVERMKEHVAAERYRAEVAAAIGKPKVSKKRGGQKNFDTVEKELAEAERVVTIANEDYDTDVDAQDDPRIDVSNSRISQYRTMLKKHGKELRRDRRTRDESL